MPRAYPTRPAQARVVAAPLVEDPTVARAIAQVSDAVAEEQRNPIIPRSGVLGEIFYRDRNGTLSALAPDADGASLTVVDGVPAWRTLSSAVIRPPNASPDGAAGTRTLTNGAAVTVYMGRMPITLVDRPVTVALRTTTSYVAGVGAAWAELALATGAVNPGGSPSLTSRAVADITTDLTAATGPKYLALPHVTLAAGEDVWVVIGNLYGAGGQAAVLRSWGIGDDLVIGTQGERASFRPSSNVGIARAFTSDVFGIAAPWVAIILP